MVSSDRRRFFDDEAMVSILAVSAPIPRTITTFGSIRTVGSASRGLGRGTDTDEVLVAVCVPAESKVDSLAGSAMLTESKENREDPRDDGALIARVLTAGVAPDGAVDSLTDDRRLCD